MLMVMPRRVASFIACWIISRHSGVMNRTGPLGTNEINFHVDEAANAHAAHRLQIGRDAFLRQLAVGHHPIDPRPGGLRRLKKCALEFVGSHITRAMGFQQRVCPSQSWQRRN